MDEIIINVSSVVEEVQVIVTDPPENTAVVVTESRLESVRHLFDEPNDFIGRAPLGSLETDSIWRVTRNTITEAGAVSATKTWVNVKWTDILTLI